MSILFSPVGTADPATSLGEGPMIHIVRHMKPDVVVLFFSPDMARHERTDSRYTKAIEYAAHAAGFAQPLVELIPSEHKEVHRFDHYIEEFEGILDRLVAEYPGDDLLVNVSSGTPAMQQALVALGSFDRLSLHMLQVSTPRKGANKRRDREDPENYDLDLMLELSEEEEKNRDYELRIIEVKSPNFFSRVQRENIKALVRCYEYSAALELAARVPLIGDKTREIIEATVARLNLRKQLAAGVFGGTPLAWKDDLLAEYLYVMEVRLKQERWSEFLRAMTPAFAEVMKLVLKKSGLSEEKYMLSDETGLSESMYDPEKIQDDPRLEKVFSLKDSSPGYVTNSVYAKLVKEWCSDEEVVSCVEKLRLMERACRNPLSHEIRPVDRAALERAGKMSMQEVFDSLVVLHDWVMQEKMVPGLYDRISDTIVESM